ncbi:MAG: F0F1 ATP synthase subunit B [Lachnospiraceae bacterium]|nr:F0F1 ATP synthase subunit B [Lachnospiraceae bacterium]
MLNYIQGLSTFAKTAPLLAKEVDDTRIFGIDPQLLADAAIMGLAMMVLFTLLSFLLFNPARELLEKRQQKIDDDLKSASESKEKMEELKLEYNEKLKNVDKEADEILSESRKKALKRENQIIDEAKAEANRIIVQANKEAELEKSKVKDEVKKEMISIASVMAGKFVDESIDEKRQAALIDETLKEMGDSTWQS